MAIVTTQSGQTWEVFQGMGAILCAELPQPPDQKNEEYTYLAPAGIDERNMKLADRLAFIRLDRHVGPIATIDGASVREVPPGTLRPLVPSPPPTQEEEDPTPANTQQDSDPGTPEASA